MKILWAAALGVLLTAGGAFATAQEGDVLIFEGKRHRLLSNPLESYLLERKAYPMFEVRRTSNWRGYVATWKIEDGTFYLIGLAAWVRGKKVDVRYVFPGHKGKTKATWYSGALRVPQGKMLRYVHMGYGSVFERDLIFTIREGKVVRMEIIKNTKIYSPRKAPDK
ncbi:MAG: hypothetical protein O2807_03835 [bacterium]|nr:hypothetical protein [bacterium]